MDPAPLIDRILDDEGLTSGLDETDAMLLIDALSKRVRAMAAGMTDVAAARRQTDALCRDARQIAARAIAEGHGTTNGAVLRRLLAEWETRPG